MSSEAPSLPLVIRRMLERDFYPHATTEPVVLVQTHISYVVLTGPYAYKVKKPVRLDFLDFSTPERRRHFCEEEVRLNQRGAPGVYLRVVPLTGNPNGFQLDGAGAHLEYAVKMRQLPQDGLFSNMLARGRLGAVEARALAATLATYHAESPAADAAVAEFAQPATLRRMIDRNYLTTAKYVGVLQPREQFESTRTFTRGFLADSHALFESRIDAGFIRECHGDLHLGNVCLDEIDGNRRILLFDCVEFDAALRFLDVMHDAAFAAMDFDAGGRPDLANAFVNEYAERTGDWEGLQVLPFYLCARAYVRALVHSLLQDDPEVPATEREQARHTAARYYRLAQTYSLQRHGSLCLVIGVSGSGKSTLARRLAQHGGAIHIRSDAVRKHLAGIRLDERGGPELYSDAMRQATYSRLLHLGLMLARRGYRVILDATYPSAAARGEAVDRAGAARIPVRIVHCVASRDVLHARLTGRQGDISDATAGLLDGQLARFEPIKDAERRYARTVDTLHPIDIGSLGGWAFGMPEAVTA